MLMAAQAGNWYPNVLSPEVRLSYRLLVEAFGGCATVMGATDAARVVIFVPS